MKVEIAEYNPDWPAIFAREKADLLRALRLDGVCIEHFGSTSVIGLAAKPVIDVIVGLPDFALADGFVPNIEALGYDYIAKYNAVMPFRRFFQKRPDGIATHNLHMVETGCEFWERHLLFRDYLRSHPETAMGYAAHKKELALREWQDVNDYANAKTEFIQAIDAQAKVWKDLQHYIQ
ncbi:MAG: GrpB family protein [Acidobacteria bacterium]|nr:GrpB family protein [Acidobacteriota bacterium]